MAVENYSTAIGSDEKTPLLSGKLRSPKKVEVKPMLYADLPKATDNVQKILHDQAMMNYIADADDTPLFRARWRSRNGFNMADGISQKRMLTVNGGESVLKFGVPGNRGTQKFYEWLSYLVSLASSTEAKKRWAECIGKIDAMTKAAFGDRVDEMYEIQLLATAPEAQGQGFASALVTTVTDLGDADGHDVWVLTSSAYKFYELLGFVTVGVETVGGDNPTWDHEPVTIRVMLRKVRTAPKSSG